MVYSTENHQLCNPKILRLVKQFLGLLLAMFLVSAALTVIYFRPERVKEKINATNELIVVQEFKIIEKLQETRKPTCVCKGPCDLRLDENCKELIIKDLYTTWEDKIIRNMIASLSGFGANVHDLKVSAQISEKSLKDLLDTLPELRNLSIDVENLCIGSIKRERENVNISLPHLEDLKIYRSNLCTIASWIFKWNFSNLKYVHFYNSFITKTVEKSLNNLVDYSAKSVQTIFTKNTTWCHFCYPPFLRV